MLESSKGKQGGEGMNCGQQTPDNHSSKYYIKKRLDLLKRHLRRGRKGTRELKARKDWGIVVGHALYKTLSGCNLKLAINIGELTSPLSMYTDALALDTSVRSEKQGCLHLLLILAFLFIAMLTEKL